MYHDAVESFCTMTELADTLVQVQGLSFRQAHEIVGSLTHEVCTDGRTAGEITVEDLDRVSDELIDECGLLTEAQLQAALEPGSKSVSEFFLLLGKLEIHSLVVITLLFAR